MFVTAENPMIIWCLQKVHVIGMEKVMGGIQWRSAGFYKTVVNVLTKFQF